MASEFNLTSYKNNTYLEGLYDPTNLYANAQANMEEKDIEKAKDAVNQFGSLTLSEKFAQLGVGKHVVQQLSDTATGVVRGIVDPIAEYLEKYENIFDPNVYDGTLQAYGKQLFFSNAAMQEEATKSPVGQNFVMTM